jgi:hypothetical protein
MEKKKQTIFLISNIYFHILKIISQKGDDKDLLRVDLSLFTYAETYTKPVEVYDCDVKVVFAKANIVFLFKHIDALLVNNLFIFLIYYYFFFKGFS